MKILFLISILFSFTLSDPFIVRQTSFSTADCTGDNKTTISEHPSGCQSFNQPAQSFIYTCEDGWFNQTYFGCTDCSCNGIENSIKTGECQGSQIPPSSSIFECTNLSR